jgi:phage protein D
MSALALSPHRTLAPTVSVTLNGTPLSDDVAAAISDVRVVTEPDALDHATLTVANPFPELRFTHGASAGLFREGGGVVVKGGYVGDVSTLFDGEITSMTPSFPSSGVPTVSVEAQNRLHRLASPTRTQTYEQTTDAGTAATIAQRNQLTGAAVPTAVVHTALVQHDHSDLDFLRARGQAIGYELLVQGSSLVFRPVAVASAPQFQLVWGDPQLAALPGSFPLQSFEPRLNARGPVTSVEVRGQDPLSRKVFVGTAQSGSEDFPPGPGQTAAQVAQQAFGDVKLVLVDQPVLSQQEAHTIARAIYNERARDLVHASGVTVGIPGMRSGTMVKVAGVGLRFSGLYYLVRVTHSLGAGGYVTSFEARSGVVGSV